MLCVLDNAYDIVGPKPEKGTTHTYKNAKLTNRCLKGMSSPITKVYEGWEAAAKPTKTVPPIRIGTVVATALMMYPSRARAEPKIKNHLLPGHQRVCRRELDRWQV